MDWQVSLWRWSNCPTQEWNHGLTYSLPPRVEKGKQNSQSLTGDRNVGFQEVSSLENAPGWGRRVRGQDAGHSQDIGARRGPFALWTGLAGHDTMDAQLWYTWLHELPVLLGYWDFHFAKHHLFFFFSISLHKIWEEQTCPEESKQQKGFGC